MSADRGPGRSGQGGDDRGKDPLQKAPDETSGYGTDCSPLQPAAACIKLCTLHTSTHHFMQATFRSQNAHAPTHLQFESAGFLPGVILSLCRRCHNVPVKTIGFTSHIVPG